MQQPIPNQKANRLIDSTSPYLLQHAYNPIDWWPWCDEALAKARSENKPLFLSIGYSACHWCHVMAHECFENQDIAALVNAHFLPIKVDREERPDLDDIYMAATVAQNGGGGWPMSVFLTPELKPFYTGTYFPPTDRYGKPGFPRLLLALADAWREKPEEIRNTAENIHQYLLEIAAPPEADDAGITGALLENACAQLKRTFDETHGGWGRAPKFPASASIRLLLREHHRTGDATLLQMARHTLDCMANGGIHDHIGGGFHRYSVDAEWLVPHFEKMLYDNAQLVVAYAEAYQATGNPHFRLVAENTLGYLLRDMRHPEGAFYSAEDADSEGEEGKFYVWSLEEITSVLGADAELFCAHYNILGNGNFDSPEPYHNGLNIPNTTHFDAVKEPELAEARQKLLEHRAQRVRPGLDDKTLTSWNALAISAFATGAKVFGEDTYQKAAEQATAFIKKHQWKDGVLLRVHRQGKSHLPGYLDDYAFFCNALIDLYECTFNSEYLFWAEELCETMRGHFWDDQAACFYFSAEMHKDLIVRPRPTQDGAEPAASSVAALAMLRLSRHLEKPKLRDASLRAMHANIPLARQYPQAATSLLLAVSELLNPGVEVVLLSQEKGGEFDAMLRVLHGQYLPNAVVAGHIGGASPAPNLPLLKGREMAEDKPTAYVCKGQVCAPPVTDADALAKLLDGAAQGGAVT